MNIEQEVREFIAKEFFFSDDVLVVSVDDSLIEKGIIDSTGALELIMFLESTYDIHFDDEEMIPENLDSVEKIKKFIEQKKSN